MFYERSVSFWTIYFCFRFYFMLFKYRFALTYRYGLLITFDSKNVAVYCWISGCAISIPKITLSSYIKGKNQSVEFKYIKSPYIIQ